MCMHKEPQKVEANWEARQFCCLISMFYSNEQAPSYKPNQTLTVVLSHYKTSLSLLMKTKTHDVVPLITADKRCQIRKCSYVVILESHGQTIYLVI